MPTIPSLARMTGRAVSLLLAGVVCGAAPAAQQRHTAVSIAGDDFRINGLPTYQGRVWTTAAGERHRVEGLLLNARLVQGIFDDLNPQTRGQWAYPDTGRWDPDRNTAEFVQAMAAWRAQGLLAFTVNLQGGCPYGYCRQQPWDSSAFAPDGTLRAPFMARLERILDRADELGMVVVLGYFYFGQDERLVDEAAVIRAVDRTTTWILDRGYGNVIVEVNNECNVNYDHAILRCDRVHELVERVRGIRVNGRSLHASTSLGGGAVPSARLVAASDFVLLHGNGVREPSRLVEMVRQVRALDPAASKPIVINEDDQPWRVAAQGWGEAGNNFVAAVANHVSWGFFDFRLEAEDEAVNEGYQSIPVNWTMASARKRAFFDRLAAITGSPGTPSVIVNWSAEPGRLEVRLDGGPDAVRPERMDLLINNDVVASRTGPPFAFEGVRVPDGRHWARVRVTYRDGPRTVVVESPQVAHPWWPVRWPGTTLIGGGERLTSLGPDPGSNLAGCMPAFSESRVLHLDITGPDRPASRTP